MADEIEIKDAYVGEKRKQIREGSNIITHYSFAYCRCCVCVFFAIWGRGAVTDTSDPRYIGTGLVGPNCPHISAPVALCAFFIFDAHTNMNWR